MAKPKPSVAKIKRDKRIKKWLLRWQKARLWLVAAAALGSVTFIPSVRVKGFAVILPTLVELFVMLSMTYVAVWLDEDLGGAALTTDKAVWRRKIIHAIYVGWGTENIISRGSTC